MGFAQWVEFILSALKALCLWLDLVVLFVKRTRVHMLIKEKGEQIN